MSSPVWQFQMGDPEALNAAEPQFNFIAFQHGVSLTGLLFTATTIIVQIFMARILWLLEIWKIVKKYDWMSFIINIPITRAKKNSSQEWYFVLWYKDHNYAMKDLKILQNS